MQIGGLASDLARAISFIPSSLFGSRKSVSNTSNDSASSRFAAEAASSATYTS